MVWRILLYFIFLCNVFAEDETRTVIIEDGGVVGTKYWDGDFYEFFGIPYAEVPTGRDRYQAPLPVKPWKPTVISADIRNIVCHQSYFTEKEDEEAHGEFILNGEDDCLVMNLYVPEIASKDNLVPVVVYIHSGAFSGGNGNMARFHYLARHDIIVVSFNYRLGAFGFACLGNREIPGNAGLKDQVAALKWIKKNIKAFGGNPNKITLAGYSVGASMAELLSLSETTNGLIDQLILDSASALSPFAINRDPIGTAKNLALAMGYNGTDNLDELTEFYLNVSVNELAAKSLNFFLPNSTFGFSPCIENIHKGIEPFLTESPMDLLRKSQKTNIPVLIGFAHMEGISRTIKFGEWRERMTEDFSDFLPADLVFDSDKTKKAVIAEIKKRYFNGKEVNNEKLQNYIDYFSDAMFKYSIVKTLKLRAAVTKRRLYFYEFNYVGKLNMEHNYMDRIKGASHRDQTAYILDFFGWTNSYKDLDMRDRMTLMWTDFVKYGDPTAYESAVVNYKWLPYTNENQNYLHIARKPTMKKNLFADGYNFWNNIYDKYYWNPKAPEQPKIQVSKIRQSEAKQAEKATKTEDTPQNKKVNDKITEAQDVKGTKSDSKDIKENKKDEIIKNNDNKVVDEIKNEDKEVEKNNDKKQKNTKESKKEHNTQQKIIDESLKKDSKLEQKSAQEKKSVNENKKESIKNKQETVKIENELNKQKNSKDTKQESNDKKK